MKLISNSNWPDFFFLKKDEGFQVETFGNGFKKLSINFNFITLNDFSTKYAVLFYWKKLYWLSPIAYFIIYLLCTSARARVCDTVVCDYILLGVQWIIRKLVCVLHTNTICLKTNHSWPRNNTHFDLFLSLDFFVRINKSIWYEIFVCVAYTFVKL